MQAKIFRDELEGVLSGAIPFAFHFQPIVDLHQAVAVGYEALVRFESALDWTPDRWFYNAEKFDKRIELESLVAGRALAARSLLPPNCFLSINVGPNFLLSEQWDELHRAIPSLAGVVIEITEHQTISDYGKAQEKLAIIRAKGGTIAVDDVGAGYASLKHVMEIRPDFVKLDRTFVSGCHLDSARAALIEILGVTAGRLHAWVIAEGVETQMELDELIRLDVPLAQGFFLGVPAPTMEPLAEEARIATVARTQAAIDSRILKRVLEKCAICATREDALRLMEGRTQLPFAMVMDQWNRPESLFERHPLLGLRCLAGFIKVHVDSEAHDILYRALARREPERFDPLVVISKTGEFEGVVRLDRLMFEALLKNGPPNLDRRSENQREYLQGPLS